MKSLKAFWRACERVATRAVLKEWEQEVGDPEVFTTVRPILLPTDRLSTEYPCTARRRCGCSHEVITHKDGAKVAVCMCDDQDCDPIPVTDSGLVIHAVDFPRVFRGIGKVMGFEASVDEVPGVPHVLHVGECSSAPGCAVPVYLVYHVGYAGLVEVIRQLSFHRSGPFVLFTVTSLTFDMKAREAADRLGVLVLYLEDVVFAGDDGSLGVDTRVSDAVDSFMEAAVRRQKADECLDAREAPSIPESVFRHTDDFHNIWIHGKKLPTLSDMQADMVRVLYEAALDGETELRFAAIASRMEEPPGRFDNVFRADDRRRYAIRSPKRGVFQLSI